MATITTVDQDSRDRMEWQLCTGIATRSFLLVDAVSGWMCVPEMFPINEDANNDKNGHRLLRCQAVHKTNARSICSRMLRVRNRDETYSHEG